MNTNAFQIDKNQYFVTDSNGKTNMVTSKTKGITEVLEKENEIEDKKNELNINSKQIKKSEAKNTLADLVMIISTLLVCINALCFLPMPNSLVLIVSYYIVFKPLHILAFGTRFNRKKQMKNLLIEKYQLEIYIEELEKSIKELKKNIDFKRISIKNKETNKPILNIIDNYNYCNSKENTKQKQLVKVKKLIKKNRIKNSIFFNP